MQPSSARRGKSRPRILYWFRTPPNVKVGREPFAEYVRRALETQNPDVRFDWDALVATPIPPPETDRWRERRRAQRAAKRVAEAESAAVEEVEADVPAEEAATVAGGRESFAVSAPEGCEGTPELQTTPDSLRRRRRRRRGRRRDHRTGNDAAPPTDKPQGE